ncbi:hypothetical protein BCR34DRAFT_606587 [Clohesyomyces aquaticus]|uniref:Mid2 domain-containing protein n=1 Tax=Clohesyomyces aquaticus TaxID=1231657 RepID=A0A1Y1YNC3_9PLEO|nr:hypothetical protein BCR34DRAFT_606587 [Clohesyomyces aquaticus]
MNMYFHARHLHFILLLGIPAIRGEPIDSAFVAEINHALLRRADLNWTTQAFQTHCDNINYNDNSDCCSKKSGPGWMSCNGAGYASLGGSSILCYNLDANHDCCGDNSVCDVGQKCCGNTCCQTDTSVTVCEDGCISKEGRGCSLGTCGHGVQQGSTTLDSFTSEYTLPAASTHTSKGPSNADATPTQNASPTGAVDDKKSGGLSSGGIIGITVSVGGTVISVIIGAIFKYMRYKQQKKRDEVAAEQEKIDRRNSMPFSPAPHPSWPQPPNKAMYPGM